MTHQKKSDLHTLISAESQKILEMYAGPGEKGKVIETALWLYNELWKLIKNDREFLLDCLKEQDVHTIALETIKHRLSG